MKTRHILKTIFTALLLALVFTGCDPQEGPVVEEVNFNRVFAPTDLTARIRNATSIELDWFVRGDADSYVVEFSVGENSDFTNIARSVIVHEEELPIREVEFAGDTFYSIRIKGVAQGKEDSNWAYITAQTDPEQLFFPLDICDVEVTQAIVKWEPNSTVTHLLITPGNVVRPITDVEAIAGEAIVTGLSGDTLYSVDLYNNDIVRGTVSFTTLTDDGTIIVSTDDLSTAIAAAADGDTLLLSPGTYTAGTVVIDKSITIRGLLPCDKPIVMGQFATNTSVTSIEIKSLIVDGSGNTGQFFNTQSGANVGTLTIDDCEIMNYTNNFIYNNASGVYGDIVVQNCYVHDIPGGGGDGIDFRGGSLGSLTVENCVFANGFRTFLRMQVSANVSFNKCTFYRVSTIENSNNNGMFRMSGGGTFEVTRCLLNETGNANPDFAYAANWCRQQSYMVESPTYSDNYYFNCNKLWEGLYTSPDQCSATEADPTFADAENGDFTIGNQDILDYDAGASL